MRIGVPISLMFVLSLLALNVHAILEPWDVSVGKNETLADKLIEASQGGGIQRLVSDKYPATPKQSQALRENNLGWAPTLVWSLTPEALSAYSNYKEPNQTELKGQVNKSSAALNLSIRGNALEELGKYDEAIQSYDTALVLDPKSMPAWVGKGYALGRLGKYDEAVKAFDEAIKIDPQNARVWYLKGVTLKRLGLSAESEAAYAKAKELGYTVPP